MMFRPIAVLGMLLAVFGFAQAQTASEVKAAYGAYAGCMGKLAGQDAFRPLSAAGFFSGSAGAGGSALVTPAQALLVAQFQAQAASCQVGLRAALETVDAGLADAAAQARQLTDANELMLIDRWEDWAAYAANRRRIEGGFWQAAAQSGGEDLAAAAAQTDDDEVDAALN